MTTEQTATEERTLDLESDILAKRLCLRKEVVAEWMRSKGVDRIAGLAKVWPGLDHAQAMRKAHDEIVALQFSKV